MSCWVVSIFFILSLYHLRDQLLPDSFEVLLHHLKYKTFFDRYLHLIEQGGLAFADRFFIAYTIIIAAHVVILCIYLPIGVFFVRRDMKPVKKVTKTLKTCILIYLLGLLFITWSLWSLGSGLNQIGRFRANDSFIGFMNFGLGPVTIPMLLMMTLAMTKMIFVAYDSWRAGTFREVFLSKPNIPIG